jgi:hypothetical protein
VLFREGIEGHQPFPVLLEPTARPSLPIWMRQ